MWYPLTVRKVITADLDVSPQRVRQLIEQEGFPVPVAIFGRSRLWDRADVDAWTGRVNWWSASWRASS